MKVLIRKEPSVIGICPHCDSKLKLEKGDVYLCKDIDGGNTPYVTCAACGKEIDVEGWKNIYKLY
jgi:hypothetical protein